MKITCHSFITTRCCFALILVFLLWSFPSLATESTHIIDDFSGLNVTVSDPDHVTIDVINSNLALSIDCSDNKRRNVRIPLQRNVKDQKIQITIAKADHIPYMGKFETGANGHELRQTYEHNYLDYQKEPVQFSLDNKYHENLSLYFKCRKAVPGVTGSIHIDKIEIVPLEFTDDRDFTYILAEILLFLFLIPGFLAYSVFFGGGQKERLLALLTPLSIFSFLVLYLVFLLNKQLISASDSSVLLAAYIALNSLLAIWLGAKKQLRVLLSNFRLIWVEIVAVVIVMFCVTAIVTENLDLPLYTFTYNELRYLTYGAFGAHDPIFQYVNGLAIFHDEPFLKYYENGKLFYEVQDRGMIVGVIYAVARGIGYFFNANIASSYGFYTLFGSLLNIFVLFPVFALHKYFFAGKQRSLLILFLISANAFVVTNYYITWYKLAGAGLVISGIVLLLLDKKNIKQWILTGIIWGLATNFHPSLALTYPVVTIWLLYRFSLLRKKRILSVSCAFLALIGSFTVMNLPWALVKEIHFKDTNMLFRQHFLASQPYDTEHGIVGSIRNFSDRYTLGQQASKRYERLVRSLRIEEVDSLAEMTSKAKREKVLIVWNRYEASFIAFVLAPLVILLAISHILSQMLPAATRNPPMTKHSTDFRWLLITQVLTIFLIIIGSFGSLSPDITWHIPMSCMVITLYLLIQSNITIGKVGFTLIILYSLFTYYRLFFQYF